MTTPPSETLQLRSRRALRRRLRTFAVGLVILCGSANPAAAQEQTPGVPDAPGAQAAPRRPATQTQAPAAARGRAQSPASPAPAGQVRPAPAARPHAPSVQPGRAGAPAPAARTSPAARPTRPAKVAPPAPAVRPAPPAPPAPTPYRVVTIVHRLSGWKLLSLLASSAPPALELDELPSAEDVHTNVVAGFLSDDNRTVVAHLPQAEVEAAAAAWPQFAFGFSSQQAGAADLSEYTLVLADGRRVPAKFVGLDAATGLSLLEAAEPVTLDGVVGETGDTEDPAVGQRVVLYAPVRVEAAAAARAAAARQIAPRAPAPPAPPPAPPAPPVGDEGFVYASITSAEAMLTDVVRTPSGRPYAVTAQAGKVSPAWTGAVATDGFGSLVGIVSRSEAGQTQIVPVETLRLAVERVKAMRANVPQPWLGARGDSASNAPLEFWVGKGWERGRAFSLIQNRGGVLLTSVAPGTPAALAGLQPGDLISRVAGREVRSVQDLSLTLKEQPIGSAVEFTVLRAPQTEPLRLPVRLSATQNPALATAEAETRAARESLLAVSAELRLAREEQSRAAGSAPPTPEALARFRETETKFESALREASEAGRRVFEARSRALFDAAVAPPAAGGEPAERPLPFVGLRAVGLSPRGAARLGARGGLLVVTVEEGSPAAACGLRPGDVIETAGGQGFTRAAFHQLLRDAWAAPVRLGVVRSGQRSALDFSLSHDCAK